MIFDVVTLTLKIDLLNKKIDGDYDFWIRGIIYCFFLARRDECPESYCRTPGVGVGVGVRVHKNFNLAYNSWTTIGRAFIFHMCIPCDKTFPWVPKFLT